MEPLLLATKHNRRNRSKECVTSLLWGRIGRKKRRRHSPATTNRGPQHTIASLMNIVQMQIVVATRLLEILQQHSSEISTTTTNDISTITERFSFASLPCKYKSLLLFTTYSSVVIC